MAVWRETRVTALGSVPTSSARPGLGRAPASHSRRTARALGKASPLRGAGLLAAWLVPVGAFLLVKPVYLAGRPARSAIEAAIVISTVIAMFLLYRSFTERRRLRDLVLLGALAAVTGVHAMFLALLAWGGSAPAAGRTGARLSCELLVAGALAAAAFMPERTVHGSPRRLTIEVGAAAVVLVTLAEVLQALTGASRAAGVSDVGASAANQLPLTAGVHLVAGVTLLTAAIGLARRWALGDRQAAVLAVVSELLGVAALQWLVAPGMTGASVSLADLFRLSAALLILAVAIREFGGLRRDIERRAISAERARLVQDLHDGLAQDLAFIASHSGKLASELGGEHPLTVAARRALDASRGAIVDLAASSASSTLIALETVCRELERRYSIEIEVRLAEEDRSSRHDFDADSREHLTRITREAIINAIKHGRAQRIEVELGSRSAERLLRVSDDGCGVGDHGSGAAHGLGLGLEMIRTRASSLDARMVLCHRSVGGTELLVLRT